MIKDDPGSWPVGEAPRKRFSFEKGVSKGFKRMAGGGSVFFFSKGL